MIHIKDTGYEDIEVESSDGTKTVVRLNTYLVGFKLVEAAREYKAADGKDSDWAEKVRGILDENGLGGLSTKACIDAADAILDAMGETEKKLGATPASGS